MIKCDNCGEKITLETIKCPNCNSVNQIAEEHYRRLAVYNKKLNRDINKLTIHTKEYNKFIIKLAICAFLVFPMLFSMGFAHASEQIARDFTQKRFRKNPSKYYAILDEYIEDVKYQKACAIAQKTNMYNDGEVKYQSQAKLLVRFSSMKAKLLCMEKNSPAYSTCVKDFIESRNRFVTAVQTYGTDDEFKESVLEMLNETDNLLMWKLGFSSEDCSEFWKQDEEQIYSYMNNKLGGITE